MRTVFVSSISFEDVARQAQSQGWRVTGYGRNRKGEFVAFATRDESGVTTRQTNPFAWASNSKTDIRRKI